MSYTDFDADEFGETETLGVEDPSLEDVTSEPEEPDNVSITSTTETTVEWACSQPLGAAVTQVPDVPCDASAVPLSFTSPADEAAMLEGYDLNGDGIVDLVFLDANGDGTVDTWLLDTTAVPSEQSGVCFADTLFYSSTGDGIPDYVCCDPEGSGSFTEPAPLPDPLPEPTPAAPAPTPEPAATEPPLGEAKSFAEMMTMTDDPATQAALKQMAEAQQRMTDVWL